MIRRMAELLSKDESMKSLVQRIEERQRKLLAVGKELKEHFVGIDAVIDRILHHVSAWYCAPEILTRPTTICLWGLTGVGKTDLVRRFVKGIGMQDSFLELQLTNQGSSQHTYATTIRGVLGGSNVDSDKPGILLLDEIQRFRSIDNNGEDIHDYKFQDLWMLLSDGSFGGVSDNKSYLLEMLIEDAYAEDYRAACMDVGISNNVDNSSESAKAQQEIEKKRKFKMGLWTAKQMKRQLCLREPLEEIMTWDSKKKIELVEEKMNDQSIYDAEVYDKLLIFVSGNLDEAYRIAGQTGEIDVDADVFHNHSLQINLLQIKNALTKRFKPEQIARFGNSHVVYPSLSRKSYETIIRRRIKSIMDVVQKKSGITASVDQSVYDAVYRNGVFPVQGTRPVFSTITSFFEAVMPMFMFKCLSFGINDVHLYYKDKHLCAEIGDEIVRIKNEGDIDKVKEESRDEDRTTKIAVHEAGHSLVYSVLFGICPVQCSANASDESANGFVGLHNMDLTSEIIKLRGVVFMAGRVAEHLVFNQPNVGAGAESDLSKVTWLAAQYHRRYGMGKRLSVINSPDSPQGMSHNNDYGFDNENIEKWIQARSSEAMEILRKHNALLEEMSDYLIQNGEFDLIKDPTNYIEICKKHGVEVVWFDPKKTYIPKFLQMYKDRKTNSKQYNEVQGDYRRNGYVGSIPTTPIVSKAF